MKILTFLEAHELIEKTTQSDNLQLTDRQRTRIVRLSGRLDIWLPPLTTLVANKPRTTKQALKHLEGKNLLQPIFDSIPNSQHIFLLSPASCPSTSWLIQNNFIQKSKIFSPILYKIHTFNTQKRKTIMSPCEISFLDQQPPITLEDGGKWDTGGDNNYDLYIIGNPGGTFTVTSPDGKFSYLMDVNHNLRSIHHSMLGINRIRKIRCFGDEGTLTSISVGSL